MLQHNKGRGPRAPFFDMEQNQTETADLAAITADLVRDEGLRLKPYTDTVGKLTIGVGRNLDDRGITEDEAMYLLRNDIMIAVDDLDRNVPWWRGLPDGPRRALVNMSLNLGWPRLSGFRNMLMALEAGDYDTAATEALDSKWARQVGDRAERLSTLIRGG